MTQTIEFRAYWKGEDTQQLTFGQEGTAFRAGGYFDPESAEYLAWLFQPDHDQNAYYCDGIDVDLIESKADAVERRG